MTPRLADSGRWVLVRALTTQVRGIREHFMGRLSESQLLAAAALEVISGPKRPH
jgi:hypothetical protein